MIVNPMKGTISLNQTEEKKCIGAIKIFKALSLYIPQCKAAIEALDGWKPSQEIAIPEEGGEE